MDLYRRMLILEILEKSEANKTYSERLGIKNRSQYRMSNHYYKTQDAPAAIRDTSQLLTHYEEKKL